MALPVLYLSTWVGTHYKCETCLGPFSVNALEKRSKADRGLAPILSPGPKVVARLIKPKEVIGHRRCRYPRGRI